MIEIREATKSLAAEIACLIMTAMTDDCCLYFCGEGYGLEDCRKMMMMLVEREDSIDYGIFENGEYQFLVVFAINK